MPLALLLATTLATLLVEDEVSFRDEVLPILSDRCFPCHGPDRQAARSDLRLDSHAGVLADLGGYFAVVPGAPEESELLLRVLSDEDPMPPGNSNLTLAPEEIEILGRWITQGARWQEHWAFVPPERTPEPPVVRNEWVRDPIDAYVLARLEATAREPAAAADPAELLRRVTLDLTGLPPSLDELDAFLADPSEAAYAAVVGRLLASPRYAERMAWEWLEAARYADTDGFQSDPTRAMWPWRDWLVDALDANVPFDQLTLELLAGDLLPDATDEQVLASGFHRNHMMNGEGGRIPEETRIENVFDRVETTATVWLGLTFTCARCHDHKYDPIAQREYYGLFDFFNQTSESGRGGQGRAVPVLSYLRPEERDHRDELVVERERLEVEQRAPDAELDEAQARWERGMHQLLQAEPERGRPVTWNEWWTTRTPFPSPEGGSSLLYAAPFPPEDGFDPAAVDTNGQPLWRKAPELVDGEVLALSAEIGAHYFRRTFDSPTEREVQLSLGSDDALRVWCNGKEVLGKDVRRGAAPDQERITVKVPAGRGELLLKIVNTGGIGGVYFRSVGETIDGLSLELGRTLARGDEERSEDDRARIQAAFRAEHSPTWRGIEERLAALARELEELDSGAPVVMVMDELPPASRRKTHLLERGGYDQPRDEVPAGTPAFLPPLPEDAPRNRLTLARWMVDPGHPLTGRVTVNRAWQLFFGRGLVATPEDFGRQGKAASHPALLDRLARDFVDGGWDLKDLHRRIVTSATYRQSAAVPEQDYRDDPHNVHLARGPRSRLPSWMIRDQALALSGLLVERRGGPPVRPYQPDGVWAEATFDTIRYQRDEGEDLYRRSLYVFWRRIVQPTFFFDTSSRQACSVGSYRTNTPLQALVTQNDPAQVEAARVFAVRMLQESASDFDIEPVLRLAFRTATARHAEAEELAVLVTRWESARRHFLAKPGAAKALLAVGEAPLSDSHPPADLAALTAVASILLNLDEVISKP